MENQSPASNEAGDYLIPLFFESYVVAPIQLPLPELLERLDERVRASAGRTPGVTLISTPASFGKTTLLRDTPWHTDTVRQHRCRTPVLRACRTICHTA
jgi:hypothetical protein